MSMRFPLQSAGVLLVVLVLVCLTISQTAATAVGSSMMFRGNPEHMGDFTSAAGGPMDNFLIKWRNPDPISLFGTSTPAVVDDVVYVGSGTSYPPEGYVYAIDAVEGRLLKTFETRNLVVSSPAVLDDGTQKIVYVGDGDGWVYAFNADTGAKIWEKQKGAAIQSSPVVTVDQGTESEYTVYIGCNDNFVYALDAMTGEERWKFPTRGQIWSSPAVARVGTDTLVFVGSNDNFVYAINDKDGTEAWSFPTGGQVWSSPAVTQIGQDTVVFVGSNDNKVYAIDARTGGNFWNPPFDTGNLVSTSPAIAQVGQDTIVFVGSGSKLYAINAITGIEKWVVTMWTAAGTPSVADGIVYVGGYYYLYGYDAATKSEKVREYTSNWFPRSSSTLVVVDGTIYFGGPDGGLWVRGVHKPLADFTADKTEETTDQYLSVTFTDQSLYNPKSFKWQFQKEKSGYQIMGGNTPSITVPFPPGVYDIKLTVCRESLCDDEEKEKYITVKPSAPVADFVGSTRTGTVPFTVTFTYVDRGTANPQYLTLLEWSYKKHSEIGWTSIPPPVPGIIPTTITKAFNVGEDGSYDIKVFAKNLGGEDDEKKWDWEPYIEAYPPVPVVTNVWFSPKTGTTIVDVNFDATVSYNPTYLGWRYKQVTDTNWNWFSQQNIKNPTQRFSWGTWEIQLQACNRNPTCGYYRTAPADYIRVTPPVLETKPFCKIFPWSCDIIPCKKYCLLSGFCLYHCTFPYGGFPFLIFPSSK